MGRISECLHGKLRELTPSGVSSPVRCYEPYPIFARDGRGCRFTDVDGREYVDMCMAYGPLILGHGDERITSAVTEQLGKGTVYGMPSEPEYGLIERICSRFPCADMARLTNSGTDATMHAVRLARGFTGRDKVVKVHGGFHGSHDSLMVNGVGDRRASYSAGVPEGAIENTVVIEYNDVQQLSDVLSEGDVAAVITEPILGNVGVVNPGKGYLKEMRRLTRENGTLMILDEVITGARVSAGGAQELLGITPDLCTLGKIIGGGFPIGAIAGRRDVMEHLAPMGDVYEAGTFSGNPVSAVAGCATLDALRKNKYRRLSDITSQTVSSLSDSISDSGIDACVQSAPSMLQVFFGTDSVSNGTEAKALDQGVFMRLFHRMLDSGVYLPPSMMEVEFLSTAHDDDSLRRFTETFDDFVRGGMI